MAKNIEVKGKSGFDTNERFNALSHLNNVATTEQLKKIVKLSSDPAMLSLLNNF